MNGWDPRRLVNRAVMLVFALVVGCGGAAEPSDAGASSTAAVSAALAGDPGTPGGPGAAGGPPRFWLQAFPGMVQLAPGTTASAKVTVWREVGFTAPVTLSADLPQSGLPAGIAVAFEPASVTTSESTMTFVAEDEAAAGAWPIVGSYTLKITGEDADGARHSVHVMVQASTFGASSSSGGTTPSSGSSAIDSGGATVSATAGSNVAGCASAGPADAGVGALLAGLSLARRATRRRRSGPRADPS